MSNIRVRLEGTRDSTNSTLERLKQYVNVSNVSRPYSNRGRSNTVRVYCEVDADVESQVETLTAKVEEQQKEIDNLKQRLEGRRMPRPTDAVLSPNSYKPYPEVR